MVTEYIYKIEHEPRHHRHWYCLLDATTEHYDVTMLLGWSLICWCIVNLNVFVGRHKYVVLYEHLQFADVLNENRTLSAHVERTWGLTATHQASLRHLRPHCDTPGLTATHQASLRHIRSHCNTSGRTATLQASLRHPRSHCDTSGLTATPQVELRHPWSHCDTLRRLQLYLYIGRTWKLPVILTLHF